MALNRFLLIYNSPFYKTFFNSKTRIFIWLFIFDLSILIPLYTLYELSNYWNIGGTVHFVLTLAVAIIPNLGSLILTIFVLHHIYATMKFVTCDNKEEIVHERKRIAWVIILQCAMNFCLVISRILGFYNMSRVFEKKPAMMCWSQFWNWYNSFA